MTLDPNSVGYDQSIRQSLASLGKTPLLKKGEDAELATIYQKNPHSPEGIAAKNKLISANLRLVAYVAKQHPHKGELIDRIQSGVIGLIRAAEGYDPRSGNAFTTYAFLWIRQAITRADEISGNIVRLPAYQIDNGDKIRQAYSSSILKNNRPPTQPEISNATGITPGSLPLALQATKFAKGQIFSTSILVGLDRNETLESLLPDPNQDIATAAENADRAEKIAELLAGFNPQQRRVIELLYGLDCEVQKPAEVARSLGLSRERTRQIRENVFRIIRGTPKLKKLARSLLD